MWMASTPRPERRRRARTASAKAVGEALEDDAHELGGRAGARRPRSAHQSAMRVGHVAGREEARVVGVEDGAPVAAARRPRRAAPRRSTCRPRALPRAHRLAQQPQAHHVVQEADAAVDAALVGEVGRAARLGDDAVLELDADEPPGAAGDVGGVVGDRIGTATTAEAVSCEPTAVTAGPAPANGSSSASDGQQRADRGAGVDQRRRTRRAAARARSISASSHAPSARRAARSSRRSCARRRCDRSASRRSGRG